MPALESSPHTSNMPIKVRQQSACDCGVACLAMAAGLSYADAREVFVANGLGAKRGGKAPFRSNYKELRRVLAKAGFPSQLKRFSGWDSVGRAAILKVFAKANGKWHWVFAGRELRRGLFLQDPATELPAFETLPKEVLEPDRPYTEIGIYKPTGCFIEIQTKEFPLSVSTLISRK